MLRALWGAVERRLRLPHQALPSITEGGSISLGFYVTTWALGATGGTHWTGEVHWGQKCIRCVLTARLTLDVEAEPEPLSDRRPQVAVPGGPPFYSIVMLQ